MDSMYLKNKKKSLTVRLTEEQFGYLEKNADLLGITPSEFLRQVLNYAIGQAILQEKKNEQGGN